jgi:transcriptional regulator with XRE-family HTH domain
MEIALRIKAEPGIIHRYKKENGLTVKQLSEQIGISSPTLLKILSFTFDPNLKERYLTGKHKEKYRGKKPTVAKLEKFFKLPFEDIYPFDEDSRTDLRGERVRYGDIEFVGLECAKEEQIIWHKEDNDNGNDAIDRLDGILDTLNPREQKVLRLLWQIRGPECVATV